MNDTTTTSLDEITAGSTIAPVYFGHATARVSMVRRRTRPSGRRRDKWFAARRNRRFVAVFVDVPTGPAPSLFWGQA